MLNQVFISYRHESPEHSREVRRLGEMLREAKIPVALDQFFLDACPGGPDEGWPKWCEDSANQSVCVLIIASHGWFAAFDKTAPAGTGLGAATEADLFRQALWDEKGNNARLRLAFLHDVPGEKIPVRLRPWHQFRTYGSADQFDLLIRWVGDRLGLKDVEPPTVRWPAPVDFQPDLANRTKKEWPAVVHLLAGRSPQRILLFEGGSGLGKSALIRQACAYAEKLGLLRVRVDFKGGGLDVAAVLGQLDLDLGQHLPSFSREGASKTHLLRKDLRALRRPLLVVLDSYEGAADNQPVADWINQQFLTETETSLALAVIVAGQRMPDLARAGWRDLARHLPLEPITEIQHWQEWVTRRYPRFMERGADLPTVLMYARGNPAVVAAFCESIANG